jgi:type III pantothenate kinase
VLLVVDVGNTQTHIGAFRGQELAYDWRYATVREETADELGARLRNLLALRDVTFAELDASILSSPCRSCGPSGQRWPRATSVTRCRSSARD